MGKISVVVNTLNEEKIIGRALKSLDWADELVVCDMHSEDRTVEIAKKYGAKVVLHDRKPYVELARNFIISKASGEWVFILDPDEEVPQQLAGQLRKIADESKISYVEIPRKNIIFGKWMKASMWWPDYNIRFFKKGTVTWGEEIHRSPNTNGMGIKLPLEEELAIIHHHYESISQFIKRMDRYTSAQAGNLAKDGYKFKWVDLVDKPLDEFLGRFFANRGFEDGLHGLALGILQAISFFIMYLKVWELEKFTQKDVELSELMTECKKAGRDLTYWFKYGNLSKNYFKKLIQRTLNKLS